MAIDADIKRQARYELWRQGRALEYLLDDGQRRWVRTVDLSPQQAATVLMVSRQRGKSFAMLAYAAQLCASQPGAIVRYAAQTGKSAAAIVTPTLAQALEDCPPELQPTPKADKGLYEWPNGSILVWAGTDNEQFERLRGPRAHLILLDESAFYGDLERVEAALLPQLQTTGGHVVYFSSPPESPAHPFVQRYRAAQAAGRSHHATIHDNPRLGPEGVERIIKAESERLGLTREQLLASTYWRREYMAEIVAEESRQVVPTWTEAAATELVGDWERPQYFDAYTSTDVGGVGRGDPSAWLGAWHDPATSTLTIEAELEVRDVVGAYAAAVKAREAELWGVTRWDGTLLGAAEYLKGLDDAPDFLRRAISENAPRQPYLRVGDNDMLVLATLATEHSYVVMPTAKHDLHMAVDSLAQGVGQRRLRIHRRCNRLIEQLYTTLWNRQRSQFERTQRDHGDLVAALIYLWRNVRWHRDCRPPPTTVEASSDWRPPKPRNKFAALTRRLL